MTLTFDNMRLGGKIGLAPMSGVTDLAFRVLTVQSGTSWVVSEMVASEHLVNNLTPDTIRRFSGADILSPFIVQLVGREPYWMAEAAKIAEESGADMVDINMGCPSRRVTGGFSGSALMRDESRSFDIIKAIVDAVTIPVTLKMRLGWDKDSCNVLKIAQTAEILGVKMITIHARTRCQFYKGHADWKALMPVTQQLKIPIIVNGDISSREDVKEAMEQSGAVGVMVGRASIGQPWLLKNIDTYLSQKKETEMLSIECQNALVQNWYSHILEIYGYSIGVRMARKHLVRFVDCYLGNTEKARQFRSELCQLDVPRDVQKKLDNLYKLEPFYSS